MSTEWSAEDVDRYLLGRMTDSERDAFELSYFDDPELLQEVEISASLIEGVAAQERRSRSRLARLQRLITTPAWSLTATAASVLLAAVALLVPVLTDPSAPKAPPAGREAPTLVGIGRVDGAGLRSSRSDSDPATVLQVPSAPGVIMLEIGLPPGVSVVLDGTQGALRLRPEEGGAEVGASALIEDGFAIALVSTADLHAGPWVVTVGDGAGGELIRERVLVQTVPAGD